MEIKFYGAIMLNRRLPARHRRDACSMAWRCRFLTARRSRHGAPDALVDLHTGIYRKARTQGVAKFRLVDDHNKLVRDDLDHFFSEQCAAAALDQVEVGIDLVGACVQIDQ